MADNDLDGRTVLLVGGRSGIGLRIAADAAAAGATVILAGRDPSALASAAADIDAKIRTVRADLSDEQSLIELAETVGEIDHVATLASAPANGPLTGLDHAAISRAFEAKVIGPILLVKHLAPRIRPGGSILLFSGVVAWRPAPQRVVMATANGAVSFLAEALAVELAPIRVNAISPGIVDSGSWDVLGEAKDDLFRNTAQRVPARRVGRPADIAAAALLTFTNPFLTGTTLHVDGGGRLA